MSQNQSVVPSTSRSLLECHQLSKRFCRNLKRSFVYGAQDIARNLFLREPTTDTLRTGEFWALKDINFSLKPGASLGLIGPNGSGKTTLLKVLSGLLQPSAGRVQIRGRVAPLLALGAGFNPLLTGRENVFVNLAMLGVEREDIKKRFDSILDFAELGDAIDAPLKNYSSGMFARLGFSCAIHTEPDLILVDEVLAVGDMRFRTKCYQRLSQLRSNGTCFVLVSHNPLPILSNCSEALYLRNGQVLGLGPTEEIVQQYENDANSQGFSTSSKVDAPMVEAAKNASRDFRITSVAFEGTDIAFPNKIYSGENVVLSVNCESSLPMEELSLGVIVKDLVMGRENVLHLESGRDGSYFSNKPGTFSLKLNLPQCGLKPGRYSMKLYVTRGKFFYMLDAMESFLFSVETRRLMSHCAYYQPRQWELTC